MLKNRRGDNIIPAFGGQIETDDLADGAITTSKIADSAITTAKIADGAITTAKIADGAVTKVGNSTVGGTATPIYLNLGTPTAVSKPASGSWFKGVPDISSGGVMEVGKYIDFHNANGDTSDYAVRLQTQGNNQVAVNLPTASGTLALTSQIPNTYSTTEKAIGTWINGKTIYRKVIQLSDTSASVTEITASVGVAIDTLIDLKFMFMYGAGTFYFSSWNYREVAVTNRRTGEIKVALSQTLVGYQTAFFIVEYTKQ